MAARLRPLLLTVAVVIAFWLTFSRLHIIVLVRGSFGQILALFLVIAVVIFLGLDHLINGGKS